MLTLDQINLTAIKAELYDLQSHACMGWDGDPCCEGCRRSIELQRQLKVVQEQMANGHDWNTPVLIGPIECVDGLWRYACLMSNGSYSPSPPGIAGWRDQNVPGRTAEEQAHEEHETDRKHGAISMSIYELDWIARVYQTLLYEIKTGSYNALVAGKVRVNLSEE